MSDPVRRAYSQQEMLKGAQDFMVENYGAAKESENPDRWYERYGMLIAFIHGRFPNS